MKILTPVHELPPREQAPAYQRDRQDGRRQVYEAARRAPGLWLPVECESHRDALYLANGARSHATWTIEAEQRGNTVYLRFIGRDGFQPIKTPSAELQARRTLERIGP